MSTQRETKTIQAPSGIEVKAKSYITGGEFEAIEEAYMSSAKLVVTGGVPQITDVSPTADKDAIHKMIEVMVVSVGEKDKDVLQAVLDLRKEDYDAVITALDELSGRTAKKTSGSSDQP